MRSEHLNLSLKVPAGFDLTAFKTGDEVLAEFSQARRRLTDADPSLDADDDEDTARRRP